MIDKDLETHYSVKCRMSLGDSYRVCGYARDEDNLKDLVEHLKKTWRYVEYTAYKAKAYVEQPSKRKAKNENANVLPC